MRARCRREAGYPRVPGSVPLKRDAFIEAKNIDPRLVLITVRSTEVNFLSLSKICYAAQPGASLQSLLPCCCRRWCAAVPMLQVLPLHLMNAVSFHRLSSVPRFPVLLRYWIVSPVQSIKVISTHCRSAISKPLFVPRQMNCEVCDECRSYTDHPPTGTVDHRIGFTWAPTRSIGRFCLRKLLCLFWHRTRIYRIRNKSVAQWAILSADPTDMTVCKIKCVPSLYLGQNSSNTTPNPSSITCHWQGEFHAATILCIAWYWEFGRVCGRDNKRQ